MVRQMPETNVRGPLPQEDGHCWSSLRGHHSFKYPLIQIKGTCCVDRHRQNQRGIKKIVTLLLPGIKSVPSRC